MSLDWMLAGMVGEWVREYNVREGSVKFDGFTDLAPQTMGICRKCNDGVSRIYLNKRWLDLPRLPELLLRSVLWHEYCHAEEQVINGSSDHGDNFNKLRARKPVYHYGDYAAKFMWGIWRLMYKW